MRSEYHETVMTGKAVDGLHINKLAKYIDATAGNGGHMAEIIARGGSVLGIEMDPKMVEIAEKRLGKKSNKFKLVKGNFTEIDRIVRENNWSPVSGIIFDLGVTNIHLTDLERGFSFENPEAAADMRIDPETQGVTASDLLNILREDQLRALFETTLDPGSAKWIAGRVMHSRAVRPIKTVGDVLEICEGLRVRKPGMNAATLPFLALRIAVNSELENLKEALPKAFEILFKGGRLVIISFHSKEDAIVKNFFKEKSEDSSGKIITPQPISASVEEIKVNRKSRSAKMRILEKI